MSEPRIYYQDQAVTLWHGDCCDVLLAIEKESVDACVTDPPYELGFMGKHWDATGIAFRVETWESVSRVLKPGAHLLACGGTRTYHRMAVAIEEAGFEIRDCLAWLYGSGFPKSLNLGEGLGTALKPAYEPIVLARKPFKGSVRSNVEKYGTGALSIDACRIGDEERINLPAANKPGGASLHLSVRGMPQDAEPTTAFGRWPANVALNESAALVLDEMSGESVTPATVTRGGMRSGNSGLAKLGRQDDVPCFGDIGGASRFFYVAKPSREERDMGCYDLAMKNPMELTGRKEGSAGLKHGRAGTDRAAHNHHPTVKPVELMRWLVRLVTPIDGIVIDPFLGSGTTGMACRYEMRHFIGIEREREYLDIAERRIRSVAPLFSESA